MAEIFCGVFPVIIIETLLRHFYGMFCFPSQDFNSDLFPDKFEEIKLRMPRTEKFSGLVFSMAHTYRGSPLLFRRTVLFLVLSAVPYEFFI